MVITRGCHSILCPLRVLLRFLWPLWGRRRIVIMVVGGCHLSWYLLLRERMIVVARGCCLGRRLLWGCIVLVVRGCHRVLTVLCVLLLHRCLLWRLAGIVIVRNCRRALSDQLLFRIWCGWIRWRWIIVLIIQGCYLCRWLLLRWIVRVIAWGNCSILSSLCVLLLRRCLL